MSPAARAAVIGLRRGTSAPVTAEVRVLDTAVGPRRVVWIESGGHNFTPAGLDAMEAWFKRHLGSGSP